LALLVAAERRGYIPSRYGRDGISVVVLFDHPLPPWPSAPSARLRNVLAARSINKRHLRWFVRYQVLNEDVDAIRNDEEADGMPVTRQGIYKALRTVREGVGLPQKRTRRGRPPRRRARVLSRASRPTGIVQRLFDCH
jgi:hypothetical protein